MSESVVPRTFPFSSVVPVTVPEDDDEQEGPMGMALSMTLIIVAVTE